MTTVTAVGPAFPLLGPPPVKRPHALLEVPGVLIEDAADPPRWLSSVNVIGYPDGVPGVWEACSTGTFRTKDEGSERPIDRWDPFAAFTAILCTAQGVGDYDEFYKIAEDTLDATLSHAVEDVLASGVSTNPFYGDTDMIALSNSSVIPRVALSMLDNTIGERTGRQGIIHATPAVVDAWAYNNQLYNEDDGTLRTYNGTIVTSESGIIGSHPHGSGGLPGAGATSDWVYATGFPEVRVASEAHFSIDQTLERSINKVVVRAERYVLAEWDKALQLGVLVEWGS